MSVCVCAKFLQSCLILFDPMEYIYMCVYICVCVYVCVRMCVCAYVCVYIYVCTYVNNYHSKFSWHPSTHVVAKKLCFFYCGENFWDLLS